MRVIGVDTKMLTKTKAVSSLIIKFLTPQSLKDSTMQMFGTGLELKRVLCQGADLSILTAIKYTLPQAQLLYDIGIHVMSAADITIAMLSDFNSTKGGFDATLVNSRGGALGTAIMKGCGWPHGTATRRRLRGGAGTTGSGMWLDKKAYTLQDKGTIFDRRVTQLVIPDIRKIYVI